MKTALLTLALAAASLAATAQVQPAVVAASATSAATPTDAYTSAMLAAITEQNTINSPTELAAHIARLERIAAAAPTAWEPRYYQARAYLKMGFAMVKQTDEQKDAAFDKAEAALEAAAKLPGANQAEVLIMQAYVNQGRIMVRPMTRGMVYTGRVHEALGQAQRLEPQNPRLYLVLGNDAYFRPAMFGGGADKAKPLFEKAQALFATYKPATLLSPNWGAGMATGRLADITTELASTK